MNELGTVLLVAIATIMAVFDALIVKWAAEARSRANVAVVLFLSFMMIVMLGSALLYFLQPSSNSLILALWLSSGAMSAGVFPVFWVLLSEARAHRTGVTARPPGALANRTLFGISIIATVLVNEFLMGWTFQLAAGASVPAGSLADLIAFGVNSVWFLFPMSLEMAVAAWLLRARLPRPLWIILVAQSTLMVLAPPVSMDSTWILFATGLGSGVMIGIIVYVMEQLYRHRQFTASFAHYLRALMGIFAAMMAGVYLWLAYGSGLLFAIAVLVEMAVFFDALVTPDRFTETPAFRWQLEPHWTAVLLGLIFAGELFMAADLDLVLLPQVYGSAFPGLPLGGPLETVLYNAVYNGFWFFAIAAGSTWFLAMMGAEMGALVVFKMRESRSRENRVRMGLMLGCYALFATFFPSAYYSALLPNAPTGTTVPVLGWSMGLGSAPIVPSLFGVILVTYAIFGASSILFGRRSVCSVFCTAPTMYQGTTIDVMKSFNRTSPGGRKYLGSRLSSLYSATAGLTMASLAFVSFASYFDQQGVWQLTFLGADPSVFFFAISFSVAWFLMFVAIPYVGNYNCVTMGWCYTGLIAAAFQKLGPYKLRVRSRQICKDCTTLDCAKGCPVGLVDMVGHFRTKGEFRSSKCCGVGDCAEDCPYGNLYLYDIRHWVLEHLGRPAAPAESQRLPMMSH